MGLIRLSLLILSPVPLLAVQVEPVSLRNEHRLQFGEIGSLEAGAVAARVDDPSAVWYNPARLAFSSSPSISGSASIYETATTTFQASDGTYRQKTLNPIPGYVGATGVIPRASGNSLMWGFGIFIPLWWDSSLENRNTITVVYGPPSPGPYALDTVGRVSVKSSLLVPALAVGYRWQEDTGIGLSLLFPAYSHRLERNTSEVSVTRGSYRSYWEIQDQKVYSLRLGAGAYTRLGPMDLGFSMKSPSLRFASMSTAEFHGVSSSFTSGNSRSQDAYIGNGKADFQSPFEATVATAFTSTILTGEVDLTYLAHVPAYQTVEGDLPITTRVFNPTTGASTTTLSTGTPGTLELKNDLNVALGLGWKLTPRISLHTGYALDKSQVENSNEFSALNISTVSAGALYKTKKSSAFLGAYSQWSTAGKVQTFNSSTSSNETDTVSISAIGVVLGASYYLE